MTLHFCSYVRLHELAPYLTWCPLCCLSKILEHLSAMSHLRFCRATLTLNSDARQSRSMQLHCRTMRLWRSVRQTNMASSYSDDAASKSERATMKSHAATLSRVRVARQNRRCDMALRKLEVLTPILENDPLDLVLSWTTIWFLMESMLHQLCHLSNASTKNYVHKDCILRSVKLFLLLFCCCHCVNTALIP